VRSAEFGNVAIQKNTMYWVLGRGAEMVSKGRTMLKSIVRCRNAGLLEAHRSGDALCLFSLVESWHTIGCRI